MKRIFAAALLCLFFTGCKDTDARVVSENLSQAADNFEIVRRVVFYNTINGEYLLEITGLCSQQPASDRIAIVCKIGARDYKKHFLGLSPNVTYFSEQLEPAKASTYFYRVVYKPTTIIPAIEIH